MYYITSTTNYYFNKFYEKCNFEIRIRFSLQVQVAKFNVLPNADLPVIIASASAKCRRYYPVLKPSSSSGLENSPSHGKNGTVGTDALCTCICCISLGSALVLKPSSSSGLENYQCHATALVAVMLALVYVACPLLRAKNIGIPE